MVATGYLIQFKSDLAFGREIENRKLLKYILIASFKRTDLFLLLLFAYPKTTTLHLINRRLDSYGAWHGVMGLRVLLGLVQTGNKEMTELGSELHS